MANPREAFSPLSGRSLNPVSVLNRMIRGVEGEEKIGALESDVASLLGMNVPLHSCPLAWTVESLVSKSVKLNFWKDGCTWSVVRGRLEGGAHCVNQFIGEPEQLGIMW